MHMNLLASTSTNVGIIGSFLSKVGAYISSRTDLVGRVAKLGIPVIEIIEAVVGDTSCGPSTKLALNNLKGRFKTVKDVTASTNVFERGKEWADPIARFGIFKSWQKTTSRICLTAGQTLETVNFIDKNVFGFLNSTSFSLGAVPILGTIGGPLFPLGLIKDTLICISAAMGIWDASKNLEKANKDIDHVRSQRIKWMRAQPNDISIEKLKKIYKEKYQVEKLGDEQLLLGNKIAKWGSYLKILESENEEQLVLENIHKLVEQKKKEIKSLQSNILNANIRLEFAKTKEKITELNEQLETARIRLKIAENELASAKGNEFKLRQFSQVTKAIKAGNENMVIRYKKCRAEIREANKEIEIKKAWISIAVDVAKIVIITLAVICMALGISKLFLGTICLSVIGFVSESCGVSRTIYMEFAPKPKKELGAFSYIKP
jgi:hypothetical protein